jgi:hypothetical protein
MWSICCIHDIELTGGIETSIRAREQLTISRKM